MATRRPKSFIVTRVELSRLLGCTPDCITRYVSEGMPVSKTGGGRGKPTTIDLAKALPWLLRRGGDGTLEEERTRYFRLQADRIQQDILHRAGELVEAADVERRWAGMVAAARERLLSLPTTALQRRMVSADSEDQLTALVDEALRELAVLHSSEATHERA
jgi:phage terminase Nu1 subunit (DNA packaging protein)